MASPNAFVVLEGQWTADKAAPVAPSHRKVSSSPLHTRRARSYQIHEPSSEELSFVRSLSRSVVTAKKLLAVAPPWLAPDLTDGFLRNECSTRVPE